MVGLGDPSGFEQDPSQDLLRVSLNGVGWGQGMWHDTYDFTPLTTELREYPCLGRRFTANPPAVGHQLLSVCGSQDLFLLFARRNGPALFCVVDAGPLYTYTRAHRVQPERGSAGGEDRGEGA